MPTNRRPHIRDYPTGRVRTIVVTAYPHELVSHTGQADACPVPDTCLIPDRPERNCHDDRSLSTL